MKGKAAFGEVEEKFTRGRRPRRKNPGPRPIIGLVDIAARIPDAERMFHGRLRQEVACCGTPAQQDMNKIGRIHWMDMIVAKPDETSLFYEQVFGFVREALQEDADHTSYFVKDGDENVLGICDAGVFPNWVSGWVPYIDVADFDRSVSRIEASGGRIHSEMKMNYHWEGQRFCLAIDPSGAPVMLCEAAPDAEA
jgi:predicted enzyme related to lactoylglutathione lyase